MVVHEDESENESSESSETSESSEKEEIEAEQHADELFVLSNRCISFEKLEHVPNKAFQLVFSIDQRFHLLYLTFIEEAIARSTIH